VDLGLRDQAFLVIGGSAGIGKATALALATDGARVAIAGRGGDRAEATAREITAVTGHSVIALTGDLTTPGDAERLVSDAVEALGGLRGMAVTTGLGMRGQRDLLSGSDEDWTATFDDVLLATARACRAVVPVLIEGGGGAVVTTAAYSIRAPKAHQVPYASLKAGVATLTKNLAKSFGHQGIRANCVCPGATETEILAAMRSSAAVSRGWPMEEALERIMTEEWGMKVALGRAGKPGELGDVIAFSFPSEPAISLAPPSTLTGVPTSKARAPRSEGRAFRTPYGCRVGHGS
jgi:NAD(P)-dependent dehydrogenase (short-subunit alcohol dehydrogenase family)